MREEKFYSENTIDDLLRKIFTNLLEFGASINPSRGKAKEISGVLIELKNPRARLSQTFTRGKLFSGLGELCWYLSGTNSSTFMDYYVRNYTKNNSDDPESSNPTVHGAYGPRIFSKQDNLNQFKKVAEILRSKTDSRQAVIQIFDKSDLCGDHKDIPCTCSMQFLLRENKLDLIVYMRSNDAYLGLSNDVFCFTFIQELMANEISCELGTYNHFVASLHFYEKDLKKLKHYLSEGIQNTYHKMPSMPKESLWQSIGFLLDCEKIFRENKKLNHSFNNVEKYWLDLIKILEIYRKRKNKSKINYRNLILQLDKFYHPYILSRRELSNE